MRVILSTIGLMLFTASALLGFYLLNQGKFSGSEFIAFVVAFAVLGLVISFSSEVQEFSIAGNIVKLKEVKKDAERTIIELKAARTETFRFLLSLAKRYPGGWGSDSTVDTRLADFWFLHTQIIKFGCENELRENISEVLDILLTGQLSSIGNSNDKVREKYHGKGIIPSPGELTIEALDNESVLESAKRGVCKGSTDDIKKSLIIGLEEYKKLYDARLALGEI